MSESVQSPALALPWHAEIWRRVCRTAAAGQLGHAVLIHGQRGIGKQRLARRLLQALTCERPAWEHPDPALVGACGTCRSCHLFAAGNHPNAWTVAPEDGSRHIGIERIRGLIAQVNLTSAIGMAKVAMIVPAEAMNRPSENALLKTLEEPPGATFFVLVSHTPSALAQTIRSRCQALAVPTPSRSTAAAWIADTAPGAGDFLDAAEQAPLEAIRLQEEGAGARIPALREALLDILVRRRDPLEATAQMRRESDAELVVGTMLRLAYRLVHLKFGQAAPFTEENLGVLTRLVDGLEFERLFALCDRITDARRDLRSSVNHNEQIVLEDLAVHWAELRRPGPPRAN